MSGVSSGSGGGDEGTPTSAVRTNSAGNLLRALRREATYGRVEVEGVEVGEAAFPSPPRSSTTTEGSSARRSVTVSAAERRRTTMAI